MNPAAVSLRFLAPCFAIVVALTSAAPRPASAQQPSVTDPVKDNQIRGTVASANGPEAGIWVIAETTDLPTRYSKIVVTDDRGRYLIPDLPKATYTLWTRGYGLVDGPKLRSAPGKAVDLTATVAPDARQAAQYYPAIYWYAMLAVPPASDFPGTGAKGNLMPETLKSQGQWLDIVKTDGCYTCHQLGEASTRTIPPGLGHFDNTQDAWEARIQVGQASENMVNNIGRLDTQRALKLFAEWTDRINAGALPAESRRGRRGSSATSSSRNGTGPAPRPTCMTRSPATNATRRSTPTGRSTVRPRRARRICRCSIRSGTRRRRSISRCATRTRRTVADNQMLRPSPYWGDEKIWASQASVHNPMFDREGRVWFTARVRGPDNPAFCKAGSDHPSAKLFPVEKIRRGNWRCTTRKPGSSR